MLDYYLFKRVKDHFLNGEPEEGSRLLAELQEKYIHVCDENTQLRGQIQEFEDILYLAKNLEYDGFSYWLRTGAIRQGPFCRNCFDRDGLLIRLGEEETMWRCFSCGHHVAHHGRHEVEQRVEQAGIAVRKAAQGKVIHLYK